MSSPPSCPPTWTKLCMPVRPSDSNRPITTLFPNWIRYVLPTSAGPRGSVKRWTTALARAAACNGGGPLVQGPAALLAALAPIASRLGLQRRLRVEPDPLELCRRRDPPGPLLEHVRQLVPEQLLPLVVSGDHCRGATWMSLPCVNESAPAPAPAPIPDGRAPPEVGPQRRFHLRPHRRRHPRRVRRPPRRDARRRAQAARSPRLRADPVGRRVRLAPLHRSLSRPEARGRVHRDVDDPRPGARGALRSSKLRGTSGAGPFRSVVGAAGARAAGGFDDTSLVMVPRSPCASGVVEPERLLASEAPVRNGAATDQ